MEKHGVENLWKILSFVVEAGNVAEYMKADKGWVAKAMAMAPLFDEITGLLTLDFKALVDEYKDWSDAERSDLAKRAAEKYDIKNEVMEAQVETGLALAMEIAGVVSKVVDYTKALKA